MDELFEILTLAQTEKLAKKIIVLIYGKEYWNRVLNLDALVETGTISPEDKELFCFVDTPEEGFELLKEGLIKYHLQPQHIPAPEPDKDDGKDHGETPEIAKTRG